MEEIVQMPSLTERDVKNFQQDIQNILNDIKSFSGGSSERSLVIIKLEEAKMWLGKELGNLGGNEIF